MAQGPLPAAILLPTLAASLFAADPIAGPGFTPRPVGSHALVGARVFTRPGTEFSNATIVLRDGVIVAVGADVRPPADARIWNLAGLTVYPGFLDPYVVIGTNSTPVSTSGIEPIGGGTSGLRAGIGTGADPRFLGIPGQERDPGGPGPGAGIPDVTPERRLATEFSPDPKQAEAMRDLGFTAAHFAPGRGILRGQSVLASLGDEGPNRSILVPDSAQVVAFAPEPAFDGYPNSLMGCIAVVRQSWLDARWYAGQQTGPAPAPARTFNLSLAALQPTLRSNTPQPVFAEPGSALMADRAIQLGVELGWNLRVVASGQEWRRPDLFRNRNTPFIVPVAFPNLPKLPDPSDWDAIPLDVLRQWDWAPENPAVLRRQGVEIALTTHGLADRKDFRKNLRAAIDRGLSETDALAALTTIPARLCGVAGKLGTIEPGALAHLTVIDGSYFDPASRIRTVWVDGFPYPTQAPKADPKPGNKPKPAEPVPPRIAAAPGYRSSPITNPPAVLIRNAIVWTSSDRGILTNAAVFIRGSRIESVGPVPTQLPDGTLQVDAAGRHVSPGIIDCHSHSMILGSVNEGTLPSSAMCRIADVVNSESENIHQQLAGGLTIANLLHGSANPIGGQNCVIKLRAGSGPDGLRFTNAPAGIKFALGENVKQANWGDRNTTRFPQTRMGVGTFYINRFTAARQYQQSLDEWRASDRSTPPPRRDLELEALSEILAGTRLIHCHSYRQDEILAFLRVMEGFGVRVASLQHILEGYKVADEIARHGAGASAFADWWAYKFEVIDAIPYAGSLLHQRGVNVSFNSDSSDHARRLNLEAAKAVKYGGTPEADALRFVTLNPARQLGIDRWVGSLEPGKDADLVIWSGSPLDTGSVCDQTWIEGGLYFDRTLEPARTRDLVAEHTRLIERARKMSDKSGSDPTSSPAKAEAERALFFRRALEQARHLGVVDCQDCATTQRP